MVMAMGMGMRVRMRMAMRVTGPLPVVMGRCPVFVAVGPSVTIGTALWREGCGDLLDGGSEVFEHMHDDRVVLDEQVIPLDLAGGVAVADMPGEPGEIRAGNAGKHLFGRDNANQRAGVEFKRIAVVERCGLRQVDKEGQPAFGRELAAAQEPVGIVKAAGFGLAGPVALSV